MDLLTRYWDVLLEGGLSTLLLFSIVFIIGFPLGVILGHVLHFASKPVNRVIDLLGLLIMSCPILVLMHWAYFPLQVEWQYKLSPFWTSVVVLSLLNSIMVMAVVNRGIESLPKNLLAMRKMYALPFQSFVFAVWLPSLMIVTLHSILIVELGMLHATLFAALIGTEELFRAALRINSVEINGTAVFSLMAFAFVVVSLPIHLAAQRARKVAQRIMGSSLDV